jgi:hypothetical protein
MCVGVVCIGYAAVLGMAFMGWGISTDTSSLLPFGSSQAGPGPGGNQPQGGSAPSGSPRSQTPPPNAPTAAVPSTSASVAAE